MMGKFIFRTLLFVGLVFGGSLVADFFHDPYYGNVIYRQKLAAYEKDQDKYNVLFIGSSRTYRHVDTRAFDSVVNRTMSVPLNSYNLGAPATFHPESYFLYSKLLKNKPRNLKFVFLELQEFDNIAIENLTNPKNYYWHSFESLQYSFKYIDNGNFPTKKKYIMFSKYLSSYAWSKFDLTRFSELKDDKSASTLYENLRGFTPLDSEPAEKFRNIRYLTDTTVISRRIELAKNFQTRHHEYFLNRPMLDLLLKLKKDSEALGIRVIFIIPPRLEGYNRLLAIKEEMPGDVIEIASYETHPQFYHSNNSYDIEHLNQKGAKLFSRAIAEDFLQLAGLNNK